MALGGFFICHELREAFEQIETVLWTWACLWMMLHRIDGPIREADTAIRTVKQRNVAFNDAVRQRLTVYGKSMVHRRNFDLARIMIFNRVVRTVVAMTHLDCLCANREGKHLMSEANSKHW